MKIFKRILSVVLSVILALSVCMFSASAVSPDATNNAPEFKVEVISETSSTAVVALRIVKGNVIALDFSLNLSGNAKSCTKIAKSAEFKSFSETAEDNGGMVVFASNAAASMLAVSSTVPVQNVSICEFTLTKAKSDKITASDVGAKVTNSVSQSSTKTDVNTTSDAKITFAGGSTPTGPIVFNETAVKMDFKSKKKLEYTSTYSESQIEFKSSNPKVATVDEKGNVTATGKGTATITAASKDGKASAECKVTVKYTWWQWIIIIVLFGWIWYI